MQLLAVLLTCQAVCLPCMPNMQQDGEVRLLDDPDSHMGGGTGAGASPQPGAAWGRTISLDSAALSKAMRKGAADASGGNGGGGGAGAEGGHGAIKARRAAAALSTLSLLGPGGSFGESVLGYPADLARQEEELVRMGSRRCGHQST